MKASNESENHAEKQAASKYRGIMQSVKSLSCDYDLMSELREEREEADDKVMWDTNHAVELSDVEEEADECTTTEEAIEKIHESALEVQVRSDWTNPGETLEAAEFIILLCTGGPAVRIRGELAQGVPSRAWIEYQDWGTPWIELFDTSSDVLCEYAANFAFME